ncbi:MULTISPECIES: ribonuclease D [Nostocales]|jgi:ribonuclease D|uniref:Ribonuclease D n=1 Tax=Dolichospermum flos-aquae CCAP 1403/13F TaxID=315271 RepID=A0A6H2C5B3_DOLFA|nr:MULTISPECIES: ribonuclease D [Nostocales]MBO1051347.1 ribonuclease D [Dolichospermum sp. DET73]MBO1056880.1 ribonuclease D [Dolichospermum sp. JUN01]MBS9391885.1 ribonuclease D [Dolichospermum sp. OL01]MCO5795530.1 ribonuclease D [Dolichospermum sp. OL03]MCS6280211.1 ribonuclease D [Dolichospermum sp.]QSV52677.1 MAG: ribonuclease D [Dolichospermum sp. UKL201]QSV57232.1 MAG: ribonuclease D [Dolichospermum sp. LBC05a]
MTLPDFQVGDGDLNDATLSEYLKSPAIAVDTETMGLLPQRDRLCLIQLCNPEGQVTAIRISRGQTVAPNLQILMEATHIVKVFHFARFDVATLRQNLDIVVQPIFCTKIASKLARTYTNRHGLKDVVLELEKVELDKSSQCSDWGNASNLSDAQLSYAANDVRYLLSVREKLTAMLQREERWQVAQECFQVLSTIVSLDLLQFKDLFEH